MVTPLLFGLFDSGELSSFGAPIGERVVGLFHPGERLLDFRERSSSGVSIGERIFGFVARVGDGQCRINAPGSADLLPGLWRDRRGNRFDEIVKEGVPAGLESATVTR